MATLNTRQKAERIAELFHRRRPTEVLPPELHPSGLDDAYAIQRIFREIEETRGRGAIVGYKIGLTTPVMQQLCGVDEPCFGAMFASEVHQGHAEIFAGSASRPRSRFSLAMICRRAATGAVSPRRSRARWRRSS